MSHARTRFLLRLATLVVALGGAPALRPSLAAAETEITVNTSADEAPGAGTCDGASVCSLRQAISKANHAPGRDTIALPAGRYQLTLAGSEDDENENGDLDITEGSGIQVNGAGARTTIVDAAGLHERVFDVQPLAALGLAKLTVSGGEAIDASGGGIQARDGTLALSQVAVRGNVSTRSGSGGGISLEGSKASAVESLIADNRSSGDGGGIVSENTQLSLVNLTIADNAADTSLYPEEKGRGASGGGMAFYEGGLVMQNVTISGNSIRDGNGGTPLKGEGSGLAIYEEPIQPLEILNVILYGNSAAEVEKTGQCAEPIPSAGHNLEQPPPAGERRCFESPTDLSADPRLRPLANNGGETDTMALSTGSPAISAADAGRCPSTDQRGLPRPSLGGCDIGAFQVQPLPAQALAAPAIQRKGKVIVKKAGRTFLVKPGFFLTCPATDPTCTGTIKLRAPKLKTKSAGASAAKKALIGKAGFSVLPGKTEMLSLKLSSKGAKELRLLGKVRGRFEVSSRAGAGPVAKATATLKLKLPAVRHR